MCIYKMYTYIYICTHLCVYIYTYRNMYIFLFICTYIYICIYIYVYIYIYIYLYFHNYVYVYISIYICNFIVTRITKNPYRCVGLSEGIACEIASNTCNKVIPTHLHNQLPIHLICNVSQQFILLYSM